MVAEKALRLRNDFVPRVRHTVGVIHAFVAAVIEECTRAVTAEGYPPPADTPGLIRGLFSQPDSTYGPSMLIDIEDGRPTEGEHTIGDLMERAARRGVSTPILAAASCNLQAYEINRSNLQ